MNEDFYIGYDTSVPASARGRVFGAARTALTVLLTAGAVLVTSQSPLPAASFAFGAEITYTGILRIDPYPALETETGRFLLVAPGKRGAEGLVRGLENETVSLKGAPIERGDFRLIEVVPGSLSRTGAPAAPDSRPDLEDFGEAELAGEIVDGKCFGGVMNPGEGTVHRDCARACLLGGLPAMFAVRTAAGREVLFELQSANGSTVSREAAAMAGRAVTLKGRVWRRADGRWILRATLPSSPNSSAQQP